MCYHEVSHEVYELFVQVEVRGYSVMQSDFKISISFSHFTHTHTKPVQFEFQALMRDLLVCILFLKYSFLQAKEILPSLNVNNRFIFIEMLLNQHEV